MIIFLIGFMGSGKSTLGRRLAKKISYEFLDMDQLLEQHHGMSVLEMFEKNGEEWFRQQEARLLQSFDPHRNVVIATGGGTPCQGNNMETINAKGVSVYLRMSPSSLVCRLATARAVRPLIQNLEPAQLQDYIEKKLQEREPYYLQAHCIIKGESVKPDHVIALVFGAQGVS